MNDLIFGKDNTERVVSVEPGTGNTCVLFVQTEDGRIEKKVVPLKHWILYADPYSEKFTRLEGNQPFKWLMEYDNRARYEDILKQSRMRRYDLFTCRDPKEAFMLYSGVTYYKGLKLSDVSKMSFDLEHSFGLGDTLRKDGQILLITGCYQGIDGFEKKIFAYDEYDSEAEMLTDWISWIQKKDPSILTGHNIFGHDFKIIRHVSKRSKVPLRLGRDNRELTFDTRKSFKRKDGSQSYEYFNVHCYGREIVDGFFLALTFDVSRTYESYGLKQIIKQEGLEKPGRVHIDASEIPRRYKEPEFWARMKEYGLDDAEDSIKILNLMLPAYFYATQSIPRSLQHVVNSATGGQINSIMVRAYLQHGHSVARASEAAEFEGAISFGVPGIHKNVLRFDVASLYPSIIRQYEIAPKDKDPKNMFLSMVNYFTDERLKNKQTAKDTGDRYFKDLEQSQKIMINSMYGFLGAGKLNYNFPEGAAAVTRYGREILKTAILWATGKEYQAEKEIERSEDEFA